MPKYLFSGFTLVISIFVFSIGSTAAWADEPSSYKMDDYRSPTPDGLEGARSVSTEEAYEIWKAGKTIFVDVLPRPPKPKNLPAGTLWRQPKRLNIPESTWLANVGYGRLHPSLDTWFQDHLAALTGGDKTRPVLFYCLIDCWMSWNAAKRAMEYGYQDVIWYADGTDGWTLQDYPVGENKPEPFDQP